MDLETKLEIYHKLKSKLNLDYNSNLHKLNLDYIKSITEFNIGDFIYNVTGIIKIEKIGYELHFDTPQIIYYGYRYKKWKGVLSRTKDKKLSQLKYNIKLLSN